MENYKNPALAPEERARDLLSRMTLKEKIGQINITRGVEFHVKSLADGNTCSVEPDDVFMPEKFNEYVGDYGIGYLHDIYSIPSIKNKVQKRLVTSTGRSAKARSVRGQTPTMASD